MSVLKAIEDLAEEYSKMKSLIQQNLVQTIELVKYIGNSILPFLRELEKLTYVKKIDIESELRFYEVNNYLKICRVVKKYIKNMCVSATSRSASLYLYEPDNHCVSLHLYTDIDRQCIAHVSICNGAVSSIEFLLFLFDEENFRIIRESIMKTLEHIHSCIENTNRRLHELLDILSKPLIPRSRVEALIEELGVST